MFNVKEAWTVDQKTYGDLEFPFHIAIRTHDGRTFQSEGYEHLETADTRMFKIMDTGKTSGRGFRESCKYGVDVLEP